MSSIDIKKKVRQFKKEFGISGQVDNHALEDILEKQGFTIIYFSPAANDPDVETLIQSLKLMDFTSRSNGFLYADENFRLVFVNEKLSEEERLIVLAHEEGHYYCGHAEKRKIVGHDAHEEYEANEFAHYLLNQPVTRQITDIVVHYRRIIGVCVLIAAIALGGFYASKIINEKRMYEGEFYVTATGEKYHRKNCVTIEGHEVRRLTKEDVKSGNYQPCGVCFPNQG